MTIKFILLNIGTEIMLDRVAVSVRLVFYVVCVKDYDKH